MTQSDEGFSARALLLREIDADMYSAPISSKFVLLVVLTFAAQKDPDTADTLTKEDAWKAVCWLCVCVGERESVARRIRRNSAKERVPAAAPTAAASRSAFGERCFGVEITDFTLSGTANAQTLSFSNTRSTLSLSHNSSFHHHSPHHLPLQRLRSLCRKDDASGQPGRWTRFLSPTSNPTVFRANQSIATTIPIFLGSNHPLSIASMGHNRGSPFPLHAQNRLESRMVHCLLRPLHLSAQSVFGVFDTQVRPKLRTGSGRTGRGRG